MKAEQITATNFSRISNGDTQLIYGLDKDQWLKTITAGQILKGRVLRVYSENKYGVDFSGQERIVDSAVPLSKGDLLKGKVIGVSDHTVSMKIVNSEFVESSYKEPPVFVKKVENNSPVEIEALRYKVDLNQVEESAITNASIRSTNPSDAIRVGLYLAKLGLPVTTEMVRLFTNRIFDKQNFFYTDLDKKVPVLAENFATNELPQLDSAQTLEYLKDFFIGDFNTKFRKSDETESFDEETGTIPIFEHEYRKKSLNTNNSDLEDRKKLEYLFSKVFNLNNESLAQHRFQTLPLIINGKLVEFDVAFFDQPSDASKNQVLRSKGIKFSLKTEFGVLSLDVRVVNDRLSINFSSQSEFFLAQMQGHHPDLKSSLTDAGWFVDSIKYENKPELETAANEIVKHVLIQNSLDLKV